MTVKVEMIFSTEKVENKDGSINVKLFAMSRSSQMPIDTTTEAPRRKVQEKTFATEAEARAYIRYIEQTLASAEKPYMSEEVAEQQAEEE